MVLQSRDLSLGRSVDDKQNQSRAVPIGPRIVASGGFDSLYREGMALIEARDEARRLVLPDGMGEDLRVLVQAKGVSFENWLFQRVLF